MYRQTTRMLKVALLPIEISAKDAEARRQLLAAAKAEELRLAKVSEATELRKQVKGAQAEALLAAQIAAAGVEERSVRCEERPAPNGRPMMQWHRLDLPEGHPERVLSERQMTKAEQRGDFAVTAGDQPSSTEAASDTVAGNGDASAAKTERKGRKTKGPIPCPGTIAEPDRDDPTKDTVCSEPCVPMKWACEKHVTLPQGEKVRLVTRQKQRDEALAKQPAASGLEQAEAQGQA